MGEAIGLKLTFDNASADTWNVSGVQGGGRSVLGFEDRFLVSPKEGTTDPRAFLLGQPMIIEYLGQGGTRVGSEPVAMNVDLNDWIRFDRAGRYRVSALLHAGAGPQPEVAVNSNEIEIEIVPADDQWLAEQLRRAVAAFDSPAGTVAMDDKVNHLEKYAMIGEIKPDGQFSVIWKSKALIIPQPFFSLSDSAKTK